MVTLCVMQQKYFAVVAVLGALFASAAQAKLTRVSLITVSPGNDLFAAFGHSALVFEDSDKADEATIYEYGAPTNDLEVLRMNIGQEELGQGKKKMQAILDFFVKVTGGQIKTKGTTPTTTLDAAFPAGWAKKNYLSQNKLYREVTMSPLSMTETQMDTLKKSLDADLAAGPYLYDNFRRNCATKIREPLYGDDIIGKAEREKLQNSDAKRDGTEDRISFQDIAIDSITEAADLSCRGKEGGKDACKKAVYLVPEKNMSDPDVKRFLTGVQKNGMKYAFSDGKDFYKTIAAADASMWGFRSLLPPDMGTMADALHGLVSNKDMTKKPISRYEAAYTPKRLRTILLGSVNPDTNKQMIDPATEIRKDNLAEVKLEWKKINGEEEQAK